MADGARMGGEIEPDMVGMSELAARLVDLAEVVRAGGSAADVAEVAYEVVELAPRFAEHCAEVAALRLQLEQAGAGLAEAAGEVARLGNLAHQRHVTAERLREELAAALADADRFRDLTPQTCPAGLHTGWYAPSDGRAAACPWCLITELAGDDESARATALAEIDEREADAEQARAAYEAAEDAAEADELSAYDLDPDDEHLSADGGRHDDLDDADDDLDDEFAGERS